MLSFEPKYHTQISEGQLAGAWVPTLLLTTSDSLFGRELKTDSCCEERAKESVNIRCEGGVIVVIDPKGDSNMVANMLELAKADGRSDDFLVIHPDPAK